MEEAKEGREGLSLEEYKKKAPDRKEETGGTKKKNERRASVDISGEQRIGVHLYRECKDEEL